MEMSALRKGSNFRMETKDSQRSYSTISVLREVCPLLKRAKLPAGTDRWRFKSSSARPLPACRKILVWIPNAHGILLTPSRRWSLLPVLECHGYIPSPYPDLRAFYICELHRVTIRPTITKIPESNPQDAEFLNIHIIHWVHTNTSAEPHHKYLQVFKREAQQDLE